MRIFNSRGRRSPEAAPWNQPVQIQKDSRATINALTADEALHAEAEDKSERFVHPLAYAKGGRVAMHGAVRAGDMIHTAEGSIAANHPSITAEVKAQIPEAEQQDIA